MVNLDSEEITSQEKEVDELENKWQYLPPELLGLILSHLFAGDRVTFHAVCKTWQSTSVTPPSPPLPSPLDQNTDPPCFPWLMYIPGSNNGRCNLFHPIHNGTCHLDVPPEISDAKVCFAKYGWLLVPQDDHIGFQDTFLFNPLTKHRIHLPYGPSLNVMSFTAPPHSSNCLVVGFQFNGPSGLIGVCKLGDENWKHEEYTVELPFRPTNCNPILYNGLYYCLSLEGNLIIFDPENLEQSLVVYKKPLEIRIRSSIQKAFLVENIEGELIAVLVTKNKKAVHVLKWDQNEMMFRSVKSLGNNMLFISDAASFSERAVLRGTGNKIYFPNFFNGTYAFYSLATKKYHSFLNDFSKENSYGMDQLQNCFWFKPM